jgi:hypothetical protein
MKFLDKFIKKRSEKSKNYPTEQIESKHQELIIEQELQKHLNTK